MTRLDEALTPQWRVRTLRSLLIAVVSSAVVLAVGYFAVALLLFSDSLSRMDEALNWDLATELNQELTQATTESAQADIFRRLSLVNPFVRVYFVALDGTVVRSLQPEWPVVRSKINVTPIAGALSLSALLSNWSVEDPGSKDGVAAFSVAPSRLLHEQKELKGYLLAVLHHPLVESLRGPARIRIFFQALYPSLISIFLGAAAGYAFLTLRLRRAMNQVDNELESAAIASSAAESNLLPADEASDLVNEIRLLKGELQARKVAVSERTGRRKEMILNIVHDLRIPVTSVLGFLEMFVRQNRSLPASECSVQLKTIQRGLDHQRALVDDLTLLTDLDGGLSSGKPELVSVSTIAERCIEDFHAMAQVVGVSIFLDRRGDIPTLLLRPVLINRAIYNLVSNALKFTPPKGSVTIEVFGDDEFVEVGVRDTGIGIPKEELPLIFDDFYRASSSSSKEGTGIGLAIVRRIIELHGGTIGVDSEVGQGTRIFFKLPIGAKEPLPTELTEPAPAVPKPPFARRFTNFLKQNIPTILALISFSAVLIPWEASPMLRIGAIVPGLLLVTRRDLLRAPTGANLFAVQLTFGSAIGVLLRESAMVIIGPAGPVFGFICGILGSLVYRSRLLCSPYTMIPILIAVVEAILWKRESGVFLVGVIAGVGVSVIDFVVVGLRSNRTLAVRVAGSFFCFMTSSWALSAVLTSVNLNREWDKWLVEELHGLADAVINYQNSRAVVLSLHKDEQEQRENAFFPLINFGPYFDYLLITDDCSALFSVAPQGRPHLLYNEVFDTLERREPGCADRYARQVAEVLPLSLSSKFVDATHPAKLIVVLRGWLNTKLTLNLSQRALAYTSLSALLLSIASGIWIYSAVRRMAGEPLVAELLSVRELRRSLSDSGEEAQPALRGSEALQRIATEMLEGARIIRAEDEKRRAFVTSLTDQLQPLLSRLESECADAVRAENGAILPRDKFQQMFDAALLQSQILRTIFEVVKIESRAVAVDREPIELSDLIEDAVIGCGLLFSSRGVAIDLEPSAEGSEIEADLRLLELMFDSLVRAIYFHIADNSVLRIETSADSFEVSAVFRFRPGAGVFGASFHDRQSTLVRDDLRLQLPDLILRQHGEREILFQATPEQCEVRFSFRASRRGDAQLTAEA